MGFELKLNEIYREIAALINNMIPANWGKFYFNGELKNGEGEVYFFYTLLDNPDKYFYCYFIPDDFNVDRKIYEKLEDRLFDLLVNLQDVFKENQQQLWYSFSMIVDFKGKMKASYDYADWSQSEFGTTDRKDYFQYKKIGNVDANNIDMQMMKKMEEYEREHSS
ncbi:DUF600 family protein [Sporolactobacillus sp. CQH2019]|uniref:immunity protein YezG family protein n=1 Tax=Sporolactobacillus sp. CQH2019 TaxID=3023512 RepID=UPI0023681E04|nr:immunity protein YezG family protein [Sporolactobacillus sp. CQH2019]MDD9149978.1 DUF600 family protein [Sporolactobacillus sp. CQH2019]